MSNAGQEELKRLFSMARRRRTQLTRSYTDADNDCSKESANFKKNTPSGAIDGVENAGDVDTSSISWSDMQLLRICRVARRPERCTTGWRGKMITDQIRERWVASQDECLFSIGRQFHKAMVQGLIVCTDEKRCQYMVFG